MGATDETPIGKQEVFPLTAVPSRGNSVRAAMQPRGAGTFTSPERWWSPRGAESVSPATDCRETEFDPQPGDRV